MHNSFRSNRGTHAVLCCLFLSCAALWVAGCGDTDDSATAGTTTGTSNTASDASQSTSNGASDTGSTSNTTSGSDTASPDTTADDTGAADVAVDTAPDVAPDVAPDMPEYDPEVETYCDCMFLNCHDVYHDIWGDDEVEARFGCLDEAQLLPRANADTTEGNNLECRTFYCGQDDEDQCPSAAGQAVCIDG